MNKQKLVIKKLTVTLIIALVALSAMAGLYYMTDAMSDDAAKKQEDTKNALQSTISETSKLHAQLVQSGEAEKKFTVLQLGRTSADFTANSEALKGLLRDTKAAYRLSPSFKLSITPEIPSDKADLTNLDYVITTHPQMKMEFDAMSDVHVFSFLDQLVKDAPGFIRIDELKIKRKGDMDAAAIADMQHGGTPDLVETLIGFTWIGVASKSAPATTTAPAAMTPLPTGPGH